MFGTATTTEPAEPTGRPGRNATLQKQAGRTMNAEEVRETALERVSMIEHAYTLLKRRRIEAWQAASKAGASEREIAKVAGVTRTTVSDQLWMRR